MLQVGDTIRINDPRATYHNEPGTIIEIDQGRPFPYRVQMAADEDDETLFWFSAEEVGAPTTTSTSGTSAHDFDRGLGIGGLARHAEDEGLDRLIANGILRYVEPTGIKMPHGQLWEPCPKCGTEPVCLDCGYCQSHCTC